MTTDSIVYKELTAVEHVRQAPDMYFGDTSIKRMKTPIYDIHSHEISNGEIEISRLLLKMFDELLMNCIDNSLRRPRMTYIKVYEKRTDDGNIITLKNDGFSIPLTKFDNTDRYTPEVIFGRMFTSSNYNGDNKGAGKNGVGASVVNIFSKLFMVDIINDNKKYTQTFTNGMTNIADPILSSTKEKNYVSISFILDLNENNITEDVYSNTITMLQKRLLDVKVMNININVFWDDIKYENISPMMYFKSIFGIEDVYTCDTEHYKLLLNISCFNEKFEAISYVNNIHTYNNGVHVDGVLDSLLKMIKDINKKMSATNKTKLKKCTRLMMITNVDNPKFDSQSKQQLTLCDDYKNIFKISQTDFKSICKMFDMNQIIDGKPVVEKSKTCRRQTINVEKLEDAEFAGTRNSAKCTLMLCEGDSASTLAKIGMSKIGRKYYGVYPLGGKPINVINSSDKKIYTENGRIHNLIQILGLPRRSQETIKSNPVDVTKMRYGKIVMLKDADTDGAHIMGLVLNIFSTLYPELIKVDGFFNEFITPMLKITISKNVFSKIHKQLGVTNSVIHHKNGIIYPFYNINEYNQKKTSIKEISNLKPVFVKGLAGHNKFEVEEYFSGDNYNRNVISLDFDAAANKNIVKAFDKKYSDDRKKWLSTLTSDTYLPRVIGKPISISDFINNDLLSFSYDNCIRSIPSVIDGLKPSQRKVLYTCFSQKMDLAKSNTNDANIKFKKIFQLCGIVADFAYYHHGDQSLNSTIMSMSQDFPGSNNLPLLAYSGSTGSREKNGDDAGQPRYVSASTHEVARLIFPAIDDQLLERAVEDNQLVEPVYYVPIIPLVLVNGTRGIGTGYSSTFVHRSVESVIDYMIDTLTDKDPREIEPYVNGYIGTIENKYKNSFTIHGKYTLSNNILRITEIPYTISKCSYRELLKQYIVDGKIVNYSEGDETDINRIDFTIHLSPTYNVSDTDMIEKNFRLYDTITENLTGFNPNNKITSYDNIYDIISDWYHVRENIYKQRKKMIIKDYRKKLLILSNKARFVKMINDDTIVISKISKNELTDKLSELEFDMVDDSYNYLITMNIYMLTLDEYNKLCNQHDIVNKEYKAFSKRTIYDIWHEELEVLREYIIHNK